MKISKMKKFFKGFTKVYCADANKIKPGLQAGLFATRDIKVGETIFYAQGERLNLHVTSKTLSARYANALGIKRDNWINPPDSNPLRFLNHSCEPNAGIKGEVTIVARKPIKKDEHITIDYSITECDELWTLETTCSCDTKKCRKIISSIQSLPLKTFKQYLPYINRHMQLEYRKANGL